MRLQRRYALAIAAAITVVVAVLAGTLLLQFRSTLIELNRSVSTEAADALLQQMNHRITALARPLAENLREPLYQYDMQSIQELLTATMEEPDVVFALVFDEKGSLVHDGREDIPSYGETVEENLDELARLGREGVRVLSRDGILEATMRIHIGSLMLGGVKVGLSMDPLNGDVRAMERRLDIIQAGGLRRNTATVLLLTLLLVGLGSIAAALLSRRLASPIVEVGRRVTEIGQGRYGVQVPLSSRDEIGELADAFNAMSRELQAQHEHRKSAEEDLLEQRDWLNALMAAIPVPLFAKDRAGRYTHVNKPMGDFAGMDPRSMLGKTVHECWPSSDAAVYHQKDLELMREGGVQTYDTLMLNAAGESRRVILNKACYSDRRGDVAGLVGTVWDITELRQYEEALEQSLEEKNVLLREVHHRVKNNMQVIVALLSLQARGIEDEQARRSFREARNRISAMARVHEKLYQSGDFTGMDAQDYIETLVSDLIRSYQVDTERITVTVRAQSVLLSLDSLVPCGLIINELVSNSLKHAFGSRSHGDIGINLTENGRTKILVVRDNGSGIPEGYGFEKAKTLGLRLVHSLAVQLEGELTVDVTEGTTVTFVFAEEEEKP